MVAIPTLKSEGWLAKYYGSVGGSTAAAAVGLSPFTSRSELGRAVLDPAFRKDLSLEPDILRGHFGEPAALWCLSRELRRDVKAHDQDDFRYNPVYPHAHVLPDVWDGSVPGELKVVRRPTLARLFRDGISEHSLIQCQHTMAMLGVPGMHFLALNEEDFRCFYQWVPRDQELIDDLMPAEAEFKAEIDAGKVPADVPANMIGSGEPPPERIRLTSPEALQAAREFIELRTLSKETNERKADARDTIISFLDGAPAFVFEGVARGTFKESAGARRFDYKACMAAYPETEKFYIAGRPSSKLVLNAVSGA